jgi:hypothetical protein
VRASAAAPSLPTNRRRTADAPPKILRQRLIQPEPNLVAESA